MRLHPNLTSRKISWWDLTTSYYYAFHPNAFQLRLHRLFRQHLNPCPLVLVYRLDGDSELRSGLSENQYTKYHLFLSN